MKRAGWLLVAAAGLLTGCVSIVHPGGAPDRAAWQARELGIPIDVQPVDRSYRLQHDNPGLGIVTAGYIIDVGPRVRGPEALYRMEVVP